MPLRIKIVLESIGNSYFQIPVNYNYILQSMIYNNITEKLADFLHKKGYQFGKRQYRMFVFSRIYGKFRYLTEAKKLQIQDKFYFYLSSPHTEILEKFAENVIKKPEMRMGKNNLFVASIEVIRRKIFPESFFIKMLSPLTIHSTLSRADGKKKTYYYSPFEKEFSELINKNIMKKYTAYFGQEGNGKINVEPHKVSNRNEVITRFKSTIIKGWTGIYRLSGSPDLILFSYDTGLGDRNSQGFGMWEEWEKSS